MAYNDEMVEKFKQCQSDSDILELVDSILIEGYKEGYENGLDDGYGKGWYSAKESCIY